MQNETLLTDKGLLTIPEIVNSLTYSCYKYNRDLGMSHEKLLFCEIGNDQMKEAYENTQPETTQPSI